MISRPITPKEYDLIIESDKKVYPINSPVTKEIIAQWFQNNPEFGMIYEDDNKKIVGISIIIPLSEKGWKKLINGKLPESEMNKKNIFNNKKDTKIGLHSYHIEKYDNSIKGFYRICLNNLANTIKSLRETNPQLQIIGFSALSVTPEGIGMRYNKLNMRERKFLSSEHILEKDNKKFVINTINPEDINKKLAEGYRYVNRCKMLITYPNEISEVWNLLKAKP